MPGAQEKRLLEQQQPFLKIQFEIVLTTLYRNLFT
jgi:hypothetical protein